MEELNLHDEIIELIDNKNYSKAREGLLQLNIVDIAALLSELREDDLIKMFRLLPKDIASDVFSYIRSDLGQTLITSLTGKEAAEIITDLFADDATDLLEEMPANVVKRILAYTDAETRKTINHLLQYPEASAGSVMTVEFVDFISEQTVAEAIDEIRKEGVDKETINTCYVLDDSRRLIGTVRLRKIILAKADDKIKDLMQENFVSVNTQTDQEEVAYLFQKYDLTAMPVVDSENRLVGMITVDDVVDIIQRETSEDIAKMAAVTPSDKPYLATSTAKIFLSRFPWLLILMVSATFTSMIITANEKLLASGIFGIVLTASIPMLMDTGGNAGSQANVTVIRGLALNEIDFKHMFKVLWKEAKVSILLGVALAVICYGKLMLIDQLWRIDAGYIVAAVISIALFITVVIAKLIGGLIPLFAKKLRLDPAVVASPFITTIVDAVALIIYCRIAILLLP